MKYLKQLIIKRKNVVYYKEEILEIDEEKTKELKTILELVKKNGMD